MTRLVSGIIAVVFIHLGFIAYMNLQTPLELAVAPVEPELRNQPFLYSDAVPTQAEIVTHRPDAQPLIVKTSHTATEPKRLRKPVKAKALPDDVIIRVARSPSTSPPTITTSGEFGSVVISYRRQTNDIRQLKSRDRSVSSTRLALIH
ncbi:hypothetical protein BH24ACI3_BH24ACI3_10340 [soil metagenome]